MVGAHHLDHHQCVGGVENGFGGFVTTGCPRHHQIGDQHAVGAQAQRHRPDDTQPVGQGGLDGVADRGDDARPLRRGPGPDDQRPVHQLDAAVVGDRQAEEGVLGPGTFMVEHPIVHSRTSPSRG